MEGMMPCEVFHNPETEFVLNFLGQVNAFHRSRWDGGEIPFAAVAIDELYAVLAAECKVGVFVRPHDLEVEKHLNGHPAFPAVITRVHSAGPSVRLELRAASGKLLQAELRQDRFRELNVDVESQVFVAPRSPRVFAYKVFAHGEGI